MNNLIPFKQYYQIYGDDHVTPLVYRIAGKRVPEELYETIMVDAFYYLFVKTHKMQH
jgi:hypothetical protein